MASADKCLKQALKMNFKEPQAEEEKLKRWKKCCLTLSFVIKSEKSRTCRMKIFSGI